MVWTLCIILHKLNSYFFLYWMHIILYNTCIMLCVFHAYCLIHCIYIACINSCNTCILPHILHILACVYFYIAHYKICWYFNYIYFIYILIIFLETKSTDFEIHSKTTKNSETIGALWYLVQIPAKAFSTLHMMQHSIAQG
jgi:hypothetical protein